MVNLHLDFVSRADRDIAAQVYQGIFPFISYSTIDC